MSRTTTKLKAQKYASESDLCDAFIAALPSGWVAYAETAGWDILLARADGFQVGVQAKLRLNAEVLVQAVEGRWDVLRSGPDCRAILVPWGEPRGFDLLCSYIGMTLIRMSLPGARIAWGSSRQSFMPALPDARAYEGGLSHWYPLAPAKRCRLPQYVPDVKAGAKSPVQLTDWKVKAIKLHILLAERGHVTREDFKLLQLDHRLWIAPGRDWLKAVDGRFVAGARLPDYPRAHPRVYEEIRADARWRPGSATSNQPALI